MKQRAICKSCDWEGDMKDWINHAFADTDEKGKSKQRCTSFEPLEKTD